MFEKVPYAWPYKVDRFGYFILTVGEDVLLSNWRYLSKIYQLKDCQIPLKVYISSEFAAKQSTNEDQMYDG